MIDLIPSCVTDENLLEDEMHLFQTLHSLIGDTSPDAHACRLKIWLASRGASGVTCEWDPIVEMTNYLQMENMVSAECRLSIDEQVQKSTYI